MKSRYTGSGWVFHPCPAEKGQLTSWYSAHYSRKVKALLLACFLAEEIFMRFAVIACVITTGTLTKALKDNERAHRQGASKQHFHLTLGCMKPVLLRRPSGSSRLSSVTANPL